MLEWCRDGVKWIHVCICVSEDLVAEFLGGIVMMNTYRHRIGSKLILRLHRVVV